MFGFSIAKIAVLIAVVGAVWSAYKFIGRLEEQRRADGRATPSRPAGRQAPKGPEPVDLVRCQRCGSYIEPGAEHDCVERG